MRGSYVYPLVRRISLFVIAATSFVFVAASKFSSRNKLRPLPGMDKHKITPQFIEKLKHFSGQKATPLIVGGTPVQTGRYPYFCTLILFDSTFTPSASCGCTLLHDDIALSAAHCLFDENGQSWTGAVVLPIDRDLQEATVAEILVAAGDYNPATVENDIAVIKLVTPFVGIPSVTLNPIDSIPSAGQSVTAIGQGRNETNGTITSEIREVDLTTFSSSACASIVPNYNATVMLCANEFGKGVCNGDSGGPLLIPEADASSDMQVGISSFVIGGCADVTPTIPDVFTRVSEYYTDIVDFICFSSAVAATYPPCSPAPLPSNGTCVDDPVGWVDSLGDGCDWYAIGFRCEDYGDDFANLNKVANQACCVCGGGVTQATKELTWFGFDGCSSSNPCGLCEGDCDSNSECAAGLSCFFRSDLTPIPGCNGLGVSDGDYCYNASAPTPTPAVTPSPTPSPTPPSSNGTCVDSPAGWSDTFGDGCDWYAVGDRCATDGACCRNFGFTANEVCCVCGGGISSKNLTWFGFSGCSSSNQCGLCEGDCDSDLECAAGLKCFQRSGFEPVPGCVGLGEFGGDYCYNEFAFPVPTPSPTPQPPTPQPTSLSPTTAPSDCTDDPAGWVDSFGDGCDWYSIGNRCKRFGDSFGNNGFTAKDVCCVCGGGFTSPPIVDLGIDFCTFNLCGLCEGDCDSDSECEGDLLCFQRNDLTPIPGCSGLGTSGLDYCYRETSTIVAPTPDPTSRPTRMPSIAGVPRCNNDPIGWVDVNGRGCDWYGEKKNRCKFFGAGSINMGLNANKACCVCGGGSKYTFPPLAWEGWNGCSALSPCGECEGNCNEDVDCIGNLECYQSDGTGTLVPGCSGSGVLDADYCYDPLMNQPVLNFRGWDACSPSTPCGKCEGDCDSDLDCAGSLSCHEMNSATVPGCRGEAADGGDYCF